MKDFGNIVLIGLAGVLVVSYIRWRQKQKPKSLEDLGKRSIGMYHDKAEDMITKAGYLVRSSYRGQAVGFSKELNTNRINLVWERNTGKVSEYFIG